MKPLIANTPCVLIVRDGWGRNPHPSHNAFNALLLAKAPVDARLVREFPTVLIRTSGEDVGLPIDSNGPVMGNSEVGHQNIGAGRIVDQELMRITRAIRDGRFASNSTMREAFNRCKENGRSVHLMGLVSDGKVHSDLSHLIALLELAHDCCFPKDRLFVHAFTDGRDCPPKSALGFLATLEAALKKNGGRIATVIGRFFAMDRDHRWDRVAQAWECLLGRSARTCDTAADAVELHYAKPASTSQTSDEFVPATKIARVDGAIRDGDSVIFFNFRGDRPRELVKAFLFSESAFRALANGGFDRGAIPTDLFFCTMAQYERGLPVRVIFDRPAPMKDILGSWLADHSLRQFRCAETEKFPHVTFFFNDYREEPFSGETRAIIPSPRDVATYDLKPEMSAIGVCDTVLARIAAPDCEDVIIVNFANCDMVGHTGSLPAAIQAVEVVDACVGKIVDAVFARGGSLVITADHGNVEQMKDPITGAPHTAHTNYDVPLMVVGNSFRGRSLRSGGRLADIAPTMLDMMNVPAPDAMTGRSLLLP
ncbi:MAG: 2,3-bisphosphoglycerate-independent phosphoglycerate mutase [Planctomycetota bacterium]|nr:2,3-bisphosphoglycerate-independent phosphoglycerate mutase [Planctomycetota bacterium]MDA1261895.1 2,3-bisphosphoglycerate-independent phosphoglycerate mutase [Planctomycetota bacterium]